MRVGLLHAEEDLVLGKPLPYAWAEVEQDLGLGTVLEAMAEGDAYLMEVARQTLAQGLSLEAEAIRYRQEALKEALAHPGLVEALYRLAGNTLQEKRRGSWGLSRLDRPDLYGGIKAMEALLKGLEEVTRFFEALRAEAGFLLSTIRLFRRLQSLGLPATFPLPSPGDHLAFRGLYDVGLALRQGHGLGNDLEAHGKNPILVTGANRGGKTTFLRSLGLAQLMMQAGLFVGAEAFESGVVDGLFTHFKREEDRALEAGKFEEELRRLSRLVDHLTARALFLFNESFAATNEAEGSKLGEGVVRALVEKGVRVVFVTHFYTLAAAFLGDPQALFLRAERLSDGRHTYRLKPAPPEPTAYGRDLLRQVFGKKAP